MKNNFLRMFSVILLLLVSSGVFAQSFLINFPAFGTAPTANPRGLTGCNGASELQVYMSASATSTSPATVSVQLPSGINYVPGSAVVVSTNAGITITENGGTPQNPQFTIQNPTGGIVSGNAVTFTIRRTATCVARTEAIAGTIFKDLVTGTIPGSTAASATSGTYAVNYPVFSFTQPAAVNNTLIGQAYSRTFSINNGGTGGASAVYFRINNAVAGVTQTVTLTGGSGSAGVPVVLTPVNGVYTVTSANLSGGSFDNGETLTFKEDFIVRQCGQSTTYSAGWGCSSDPAAWCQTVTGTGNTSAASGTPSLGRVTGTRENFTSQCSPYNLRFVFENTGTGGAAAGGMYNVQFRWGGGSGTAMDGSGTRRDIINYLSATIGTVSGITVTNGTVAGQVAIVDINNKFSTDPDGAGVGLADLDGDGFYDDLPAGQSATVIINAQTKCDAITPTTDIFNSYDYNADMRYSTMCNPTLVTSQKLNYGTLTNFQYSQLSNKSYAPANITGGSPFRTRFAIGAFALNSAFDNSKTRYVYQITLPAGVTVSGSGNPAWHSGIYPANANTTTAPEVTTSGNVVTIISPTSAVGWVELDLVYTCGNASSLSIPFTFQRYDNIDENCTTQCNASLLAGTVNVGKVLCPSLCSAGVTSLNSVKVERADNSLGWTDATLNTRQSRSAISSYDLSKALYLDDFDVKVSGTYAASPLNNLYLYTGFTKKVSQAGNIVTPTSMDVTVRRGGVTVYTGNTNQFAVSNTTSLQRVRWNLISIISAANLQTGDVIETVAHYSVSSNQLPTHDEQTGEKVYFYALDSSNAEVLCNDAVPEMYLATITFVDGSNASNFKSCTTGIVANGTHYLAGRFDAQGIQYLNEVRPGIKLLDHTFVLPSTFTLNRVEYTGIDTAVPKTTLTYTANGTTYSAQLPNHTDNITVTNNYSSLLNVFATPTCGSSAAGQTYTSTINYIPYYYHYVGTSNAPTAKFNVSKPLTYDTATQPAVSITNITGSIQATKPTESFVFRINSTGSTTAPYVWFAIPDQTGVSIAQVTDVTGGTNTVLNAINYSGGKWYQVSTTGLAPGTSKEFKVDFNYTNCSPTTIQVRAGWNCSSYPSSPAVAACTPVTTSMTFTPQLGSVQVETVQQPATPLSGLCEPLNYEFRVNSAGAGNLKDVKFEINSTQGLTVNTGTLQAQYPAGSGNWTSVPFTTSGNTITADLSSMYPATGLPGTLNDGGVQSNRQIGIRFSVTTDCNFVSGSNFTVAALANNSCGSATTGSGSKKATNSLTVAGAEPTYTVSTTISTDGNTAFNNCPAGVNLTVKQVISALNATGSNGKIRFDLPAGFDFQATPFTNVSGSAPTLDGVYTDSTTGTRYLMLNLPSGLVSGDELNYTVNLVTTNATCGAKQINVRTLDQVGAISCPTAPTGVCDTVNIETGKFAYDLVVNKPQYAIVSMTGTMSSSSIFGGSVTVRNNGIVAATQPAQINFYCADDAGNPTGTLLGTVAMSNTIAAGTTVTENYSFSVANYCATGKIYAVISAANNCACSDSNSMILNQLCYNPVTNTAAGTPVKHGITLLKRAGADNGNWPMNRNSAHTALESNTKGFVITRVPTSGLSAITNPVEGMMVYDTTAKCLKIYVVDNTTPANTGWKCFSTPACP